MTAIATQPLRADIRAQRSRPRGRRAASVTGEVLLWITATAGVVCAALAILGAVFGFRVMLFKTGSMEPTIATGSAALVMPVAAADVEVGDVVTVERGGGELPVTHRVVEIDEGTAPDARLLTLRGDANAANDPVPYEVTEAGRVLFSVPGVAPAIATLSDPRILGPIGIAAAGFVVWGLWPRGGREER